MNPVLTFLTSSNGSRQVIYDIRRDQSDNWTTIAASFSDDFNLTEIAGKAMNVNTRNCSFERRYVLRKKGSHDTNENITCSAAHPPSVAAAIDVHFSICSSDQSARSFEQNYTTLNACDFHLEIPPSSNT